MMKENIMISVSPKEFENILTICAAQGPVKEAIILNHDNNLWWPRKIKDWRIRMLIAGLSTRVSYRSITNYRMVVEELGRYNYEQLKNMPEQKFKDIIRGIGLSKLRVKFWKSLAQFIESFPLKYGDIDEFSNNELIEFIQREVYGASYHVAQNCVLYARGYHCGIVPVDAGMKDTLGPCLGFPIPHNSYGYEIFRKQLEALTKCIDCRKIAIENEYNSLSFPSGKNLTWWVHLVLIYYKRFFCNTHDPDNCPLKHDARTFKNIGTACHKIKPQLGGIKNVIIEGIDGTGKSTLAKALCRFGFKMYHFDYDEKCDNLKTKYEHVLKQAASSRILLDRSFISEQVYGSVLREKGRLSENDFLNLLRIYHQRKSVLVYLFAPQDVLLKRKNDRGSDFIKKHFSSLEASYESTLKRVQNFIPVIRVNTGVSNLRDTLSIIIGLDLDI